jgi:alpha-glucosidase (family GH31 glycosyl hydrolase)
MMRHLFIEYPDDTGTRTCHDQFMLGDLMIAPIIEEGATARTVYLPDGTWYSFRERTTFLGGQTITVTAALHEIPVFLRTPGAFALNLADTLRVGDSVGNTVGRYKNFILVTAGQPDYQFEDDLGNSFILQQGKLKNTAAPATKNGPILKVRCIPVQELEWINA